MFMFMSLFCLSCSSLFYIELLQILRSFTLGDGYQKKKKVMVSYHIKFHLICPEFVHQKNFWLINYRICIQCCTHRWFLPKMKKYIYVENLLALMGILFMMALSYSFDREMDILTLLLQFYCRLPSKRVYSFFLSLLD